MKHVRLLPAVIVMGLALLVLKGTGLVREAQAQNAATQIADASAPASSATKDFAGGDDDTSSASEIDVLSSLAKRRAELDRRAKSQDMRENVLAATEQRVDGKIAKLKQLQAQITALLGQRDAAQEAQVKSLVKTYSAMKPKDAARIFDGLSEDVLIPVAQEMKSDALAPVLAAMNPSAAQKLTVKLASKLALPEKAEPDAPPPAAAAPAPPPAEQTAAAAPPAEQPAAATTPAPQPAKPTPQKRAHARQAAATAPPAAIQTAAATPAAQTMTPAAQTAAPPPAPKAPAPQLAASQAAAPQTAPPARQAAATPKPQPPAPQAAAPQTATVQAPHA